MLGRLRGWLFRGQALERARAEDDPRRKDHARRARAAADLGDSARELNPLEDGASFGVACELYREAVHWTLLALSGRERDGSAGPWQGVDRSVLSRCAGSDEELRELERLLGTPSFVEFGTLPGREQAIAVEKLARFAHALLGARALLDPEVSELLAQRLVRSLGALLLLVGIVVLVVSRSERWLTTRADLARGKPWRASSELVHCDRATKSCGEFRELEIFFHTLEEPSPWLEIDLGAEHDFSRVMVKNRMDCCGERALPLVVEVSRDQAHWTEAMRRTTPFSIWIAKFSRQRARWVRLRVATKSMLHLENVKVLP